MRALPLILVALAGLLAACSQSSPAPAPAAVPAASDPLQAVLKASQRFAALRSFHADMSLHGAQSGQVVRMSMDYVAPDRYLLQGPGGPQTIIGDTFFLKAEGRMHQVPVPAGTLEQWRNPLPGTAALQGLATQVPGVEDIAGTATRHYRLDGLAGSGETLQYWIAADGLPRQIQRDGFNGNQPYRITLRYTRLDDPTLTVPDP